MASIWQRFETWSKVAQTGCSGEYSPLDHRPESGSGRRIAGQGGRSGCPITLRGPVTPARGYSAASAIAGRRAVSTAREPQTSGAFLGMSHARSQTWFRNEVVTEAVSALWKRARPLRPHVRRDRLVTAKVAIIVDATFRASWPFIFLRSALQAGALSPFRRVKWDRRARVPFRSAS